MYLKNNTKLKVTLISAAIVMSLCGCQNSNTASSELNQQASIEVSDAIKKIEAKKVDLLVEKYFSESMVFLPIYATFYGIDGHNDKFRAPISDENQAKFLAFENHYLTAIYNLNPNLLSGQSLLSYEIFKRDREMAIKGHKFDSQFIPISQMDGAHSIFAMLGSGSSAQPFNSEKDYYNFISRADGFADYMNSVIVAMRKGIEKGVVHPIPITEKLIPQLSAHILDDITQSVFYGPVKKLDDNSEISDAAKAKLRTAYIATIKHVIIPSYLKVYEFLVEEYLPKSRSSIGLSDLPQGKPWYEYMIETNTTLPLTALEIHEVGLQEVARILTEMKKVKQQVHFGGNLTAFFEHLRTDKQFYFESKQDIIDGYIEVKDRINARLPQLFEVFPKADYVVKAVEEYREESESGASYFPPAPDGSRPGVFYINTRDLMAQAKFSMETLSLHEAAPGHHFQMSIQQEVESLPKFRKFGSNTVFVEGWALYAESLGKELGLFTEHYMWYGRLSDEQLRAMRLVVDTGIHALGWTKERAINFMRDNSSMAQSFIDAEVERYISIPGQALAYKTGERHIRMLRNRAIAALEEKFDVRKFHTQILIDGSLPMPILESKMDRWIAEQLKKST